MKRSDDLLGRINRITPGEGRDELFLEGLLRNDRETMSQLYDIYGGMAYGLAHRTLGATADAEDVVQDVIVGDPATCAVTLKGTGADLHWVTPSM